MISSRIEHLLAPPDVTVIEQLTTEADPFTRRATVTIVGQFDAGSPTIPTTSFDIRIGLLGMIMTAGAELSIAVDVPATREK
jgi:hypothetical protein